MANQGTAYGRTDRPTSRYVYMSGDVTFQFLWANAIRQMRYGSHRIIPLNIAERAWPATGQNEVMQLAMVVGGNQVEPTRSTVQRIRHDLKDDLSFIVTQSLVTGDIHIERPMDFCPFCKGSGVVRVGANGPVPVMVFQRLSEAAANACHAQSCTHDEDQLPELRR